MEEKKSMLLEGLVPVDIWNALIVLLILFGVFIAVFQGYVLLRDEVRKAKERKEINSVDVTERIAEKVLEKLKPEIDKKFDDFDKGVEKRFVEIDKKLSADKETLVNHTVQLNDHESRVGRLEGGGRALCHGMLALLEQDPEHLKKAQHAMTRFLVDGKYNEEDW